MSYRMLAHSRAGQLRDRCSITQQSTARNTDERGHKRPTFSTAKRSSVDMSLSIAHAVSQSCTSSGDSCDGSDARPDVFLIPEKRADLWIA